MSFSVEGEQAYARWRRDGSAAGRPLVEPLARWHAAHPLVAGMDMEEAARALPEPSRAARCSARSWNSSRPSGASCARAACCASRTIGSRRRATNARSSNGSRRCFDGTPLAPPDVKQMTQELGVDRVRADRASAGAGEAAASRARWRRTCTFSADAVERVKATRRATHLTKDGTHGRRSSAIAIRPPGSTRFRFSNTSTARASRSGTAMSRRLKTAAAQRRPHERRLDAASWRYSEQDERRSEGPWADAAGRGGRLSGQARPGRPGAGAAPASRPSITPM